MQRTTAITVILLAASLMISGAMLPVTNNASGDEDQQTIQVGDLNRIPIIGRLGVPLGQVVVIEGDVIDDEGKLAKGRGGTLILRINTVERQPLEKSVDFLDEVIVRDRKRVGLTDGRYRLAVYETGSFTGWPKGDTYRPVPQTHGFHFQSELVIVHNFADKPVIQRR